MTFRPEPPRPTTHTSVSTRPFSGGSGGQGRSSQTGTLTSLRFAAMYAEIVGPEQADPVVALHGGIGTGHYHWSKLVKGLSAEYRLHLPDLPGHGQTPLDEGAEYSRDLQVAAIEAYLDDLGAPAHVMGFSMGGHACLALATKRPHIFGSRRLPGVSSREHKGLHGWRHKFAPDDLERGFPVWARHLSKIHAPLGGPDAWKDVCRRDSKGL